MIVVKIELWPQGDQSKKKSMGECRIANMDTGTEQSGNYHCQIFSPNGRKWREAIIDGFPRKKLGAWDLLMWALVVAIGDRTKAVPDPKDPTPEPGLFNESGSTKQNKPGHAQ